MVDGPEPTGRASAGLSGVMRRAADRVESELEQKRLRAGVKAGLFGKPQEAPQVGRFRVVSRLGSGGLGTVFEAVDTASGRTVALKVLESDDRELRSRLQREGRALAKLEHPNVVSVYEVGPFETGVYLAMERIDGRTLREWLETRRSFEAVMHVFLQAANALDAAHGIGIIHRDFKLENVMVDDDGHVSLLDFGLAKASPRQSLELAISGIQSKLTEPGRRMGTPGYMAPEQVLGEPVDVRTDVFAFCVALYEALYREHPFPGDSPEAKSLSVLRGRVRRPPEEADGVPSHVGAALLHGLSFDPEDRPAQMTRLVEELTNPAARSLVVGDDDEQDGQPGVLVALVRLLRALVDRILGGR